MKKRNETIRMLVLSAMFAALCCVTTMLVRFPTVAGYTNIGEGMCLLAGLVLGPWYGFFAAGIGSGLADLLAGYAHYVPGTFIIKGLVALVAALLLPTGRFCMRLFSTEPAVIESGFAYLARILPFYWMLAIMFVLSSIMRGAGEMMVPMISSLAALWLARVPAAYLLAHFFGPMNIHFCYAIGWALGLAICVPYYFSGRWKEKSIVVRAAGGS